MAGGSRMGVNSPTLVSYRWPLAGSPREMQVTDGCTPFLYPDFS